MKAVVVPAAAVDQCVVTMFVASTISLRSKMRSENVSKTLATNVCNLEFKRMISESKNLCLFLPGKM